MASSGRSCRPPSTAAWASTRQVRRLRQGPEIVVATPGRLLDHVGQRTIDLSRVEVLVLDEADRMLDMGFIHDIRKILALLPVERQNLLFSATFSAEIRRLAGDFLKDPAFVQVTPKNTAPELVTQVVIPVDRSRKRELLSTLVKSGRIYQALVFTRTKHGADRLAQQLELDGITAVAIHGNKSQPQRIRALNSFKQNKVAILVATEVAARGLDIDALPHVVNYELPMVASDYLHRIGRTGRAGTDGDAISLVCVDEQPMLADIERLLGIAFRRRSSPASRSTDRSARRPSSSARPSTRRAASTARATARRLVGRRPTARSDRAGNAPTPSAPIAAGSLPIRARGPPRARSAVQWPCPASASPAPAESGATAPGLRSGSLRWSVEVDDCWAIAQAHDDGLRRVARRAFPVDHVGRHERELARLDHGTVSFRAVFEFEPAAEHIEVGVVAGMVVPAAPLAWLGRDITNPAALACEGLLTRHAWRLVGRWPSSLIGRDHLRSLIQCAPPKIDGRRKSTVAESKSRPHCCGRLDWTLRSDQAAETLLARGPRGLCSIWNSTFSPPTRRSKLSDESSASRWKKYSLASSAVMKPKPRSEMTFLTVPVATMTLQRLLERLTLTHDLFEKRRSHGATAHRGECQ